MATVDELDTEIAALRSIRAQGVLTVRHSDGRSVTFQNPADLSRQIDRLEKERARLAGTGRRRRTIRLYQSGRGL